MKKTISTLAVLGLLGTTANANKGDASASASHPYVGLWVTEDGRIRHELLPNGRYLEARGNRERAYEGRYEVTGTHIEYCDDTGFSANGEFVEPDALHHASMILYRK
jgi:hypothetical protein